MKMIDIKNVSMKFNLGIEKDLSIKQAFINIFSGKKKKKNEERRKREREKKKRNKKLMLYWKICV